MTLKTPRHPLLTSTCHALCFFINLKDLFFLQELEPGFCSTSPICTFSTSCGIFGLQVEGTAFPFLILLAQDICLCFLWHFSTTFLRQLPIPLVDLHVSPLPQLFPTLTATGVPPTNLQDIFTLQFLERMEVPCCNQKYDAVKTQVSLWRKITIQPDFLDNRWTLGLLTG